jgi:hypothetical protein
VIGLIDRKEDAHRELMRAFNADILGSDRLSYWSKKYSALMIRAKRKRKLNLREKILYANVCRT